MTNDLLDNTEIPQQPEAVEARKPSVEKILEGHCRLISSIHRDKTPQERLIVILRRVYQRGKDNQLLFENFSPDFQTPEIKKALDAFKTRKKK
jgi:hypothetical protein